MFGRKVASTHEVIEKLQEYEKKWNRRNCKNQYVYGW